MQSGWRQPVLTTLLKSAIIIPGTRQFTQMFLGANSSASVLVRPSRAVLLTSSSHPRLGTQFLEENDKCLGWGEVEESICWISHSQGSQLDKPRTQTQSARFVKEQSKGMWVQAQPRTSGVRQVSILVMVPGGCWNTQLPLTLYQPSRWEPSTYHKSNTS